MPLERRERWKFPGVALWRAVPCRSTFSPRVGDAPAGRVTGRSAVPMISEAPIGTGPPDADQTKSQFLTSSNHRWGVAMMVKPCQRLGARLAAMPCNMNPGIGRAQRLKESYQESEPPTRSKSVHLPSRPHNKRQTCQHGRRAARWRPSLPRLPVSPLARWGSCS